MNELYSDKVMAHFRKPKNMGEMKNPSATATVGNPVCGDVMRMFIKVAKKNEQEIIDDIKFQTLGCGAALATSSVTTELAKGKTLAQALKINAQMIIKELGGLPTAKRHCSLLAHQALRKVIANYRKTKKV
jgi:nitrogen fixation NifU-like protein